MAVRLTDKKKKRIIADYIELQNYHAVARIHGVCVDTVKRTVLADKSSTQKAMQKKEQNTLDMLAFMDSRRDKMQFAIDSFLDNMTDAKKIQKAGVKELATAFGIVVDKAVNVTSSSPTDEKLDALLDKIGGVI